MKINIQVRQSEFAPLIEHLKSQMGYYDAKMEGTVQVLLGDKFNLYIYPYHTALLPSSMRQLDILPKPETV